MALEIERKFLVIGNEWRRLAEGLVYRQGYLSTAKECTVRVRTVGGRAYLTIKGITEGINRLEYEYEIPVADGTAMIEGFAKRPIIEKVRYKIPFGGHIWEVDEFFGENRGLVVAEIELDSEDQLFTRPTWVGVEVSNDERFFNSNLVIHPYPRWFLQRNIVE